MLPLPPNGVALSVGAAAALVRTAQVGPLPLLELGVAMKARLTTRAAHTTPAAMMLAMNALVLIAPPILARLPSGDAPLDTIRHREQRPPRFRHGSWVPRVDQK